MIKVGNHKILFNFKSDKQIVIKKEYALITKDKITEIFCVIDEFCKKFDAELENSPLKVLPSSDGKHYINGQKVQSTSDSW